MRVLQSILEVMRELRIDSTAVMFSRGVSGAFVVNLAGTGILFALHVLLARIMSVEQYGTYIYAFTWITVLILVGKLGLDTTLVRYIAMYNAQKAWGPLRGVLRKANELVAIGSVLVGAVVALLVWILRDRLAVELTQTLWFGCVLLPFLSLTKLRQAALQALKRVALAQLPEMVLCPLLLGMLAALLWVISNEWIDGPTVMALHGFAMLVALLMSNYWLSNALPKLVKFAVPEYRTREWLTASSSLFLISGMLVILGSTDIIMIGAMIDRAHSGIYSTASRVSGFTAFGLYVTNVILAPMISELYHTRQRHALQRVVTLGTIGGTAFAFLTALVFLLCGNWILRLFGPEFAAGYLALLILTTGQLVNVSAGSVGFLMTMTGHERIAAYALSGSTVLNVCLNLLLIPQFGIEGAAIATASTIVLWNLILSYYVQTRVEIRPSLLSWLIPRSSLNRIFS